MKSKRAIIAAAIVAVGLLVIVCVGLFRDFDAQGYVRGTLDLTFQGEVDGIMQFTEDQTQEELYRQYEEGVASFVENNITNGIEISDEMQMQYELLTKEIFAVMQYDVKEAEKINRKEYRVTVTYQSADVFQKFISLVAQESETLMAKVEKGEYKGTAEEINEQMRTEYIQNCYEHLKTAYSEIQYGETEEIVFTVKKGDSGLFVINDEQIYDLTTKIMGLDKIPD